jgi:spore maturation protein CgeB
MALKYNLMKIFYVNEIEQTAGWGAEYSINRSLRLLGHSTYCLDYRKNWGHLYPEFLRAPEYNVFFLQRGAYFPIRLIKSISATKFFWASEISAKDQDRLLRSDLFDHIFMRTSEWIDRCTRLGWVDPRHCSVLLSGFDELLHYPIQTLPRDIDVLFIGTMSARRQRVIDEIGKHFSVRVVSAFGKEMVRYINRSKIVLNIHVSDILDSETRIYEVLGCRAFLLSETLSPENPFTEDELVQYSDLNDLFDKIQYFLSHEEERERIASNGYQTAIENHTYTHRAREICDVMSKYMDSDAGSSLSRGLALHSYGVRETIHRIKNRLRFV